MSNIASPPPSTSLPTPALEQVEQTSASGQVEPHEEHSVRTETPSSPRLQDGGWKARFKNLFHVSPSNREAKISAKEVKHKSLQERSAKVGKSGGSRFARLKQAYNAFKAVLKRISKFFSAYYNRASTARKRLAHYEKFYNANISTLSDDVEENKETKRIFRESMNRAKEILSKYPDDPSEETDKITQQDKPELKENFKHIGSIAINYIIDNQHALL